MMVTVVVLTVGLLGVYKAFFLALDYTNHLTYRLHAMMLLDEKISTIERFFLDKTEIAFDRSEKIKTVQFDNKQVDFHYTTSFESVENVEGLFLLDVALSWLEGSHQIHLSRSVYISDYKLLL